MAKKQKAFPLCTEHKDCFALNEEGRCVCLSENDFDGGCPFYKPITEISRDEIRTACEAYAATHSGKEVE